MKPTKHWLERQALFNSTSRLTGSEFFNLLTICVMDEPNISYEGMCDILEQRNPELQISL